MLIEFKVANFRSFREEQTLSLVASKDAAHPENLIDCGNFKLLKSAAVFGANASGKSSLIAAIEFMRTFVTTSATRQNLGDRIKGVSPFRLDRHLTAEPCQFQTTAVIAGVRYVYGFSATVERVHDEWLDVCRPGGRLTRWLERRFNALSGETTWRIRGPLKKDADLLREKTRENGLLLSRGAELNVASLKELFLWVRNRLEVVDLSQPTMGFTQWVAGRVREDDAFRNRVLMMIRDADLGIESVDVAEAPLPDLLEDDDSVSEEVSAVLTAVRKLAASQGLDKRLSVTTFHPTSEAGRYAAFQLESDESRGTQRFFAISGLVLDVLENGSTLIVDELDCSMHPRLVRKLIELFQSPAANKSGAQLVFATHDSTLMDSSLFRRDQVWLTEKSSAGATQLFSLYDFDTSQRPRLGEALAKNYLAGRYGAVPNFGPVFEDFEIQ